ncbi:MAG: fused MFS/spermidine synthase [Alphaproteobacteria bacterium]
MSLSKTTIALFTLIILEGYVVLSSELLAIRLSLPFVGSGTDTVSIIIAAVLMPLAFGYQAGGRFKPGFHNTLLNGKIFISVREKLITNILIALGFLLFGLSYSFLDAFFTTLLQMGLTHRVLLTTLYAALFIVTPVYLLGQTIPLTCNFFTREKLSKITGRILFFSTLGSFLGAVFSTLVLMSYFGINITAAVNFVILGLLITLLSKEKFSTRMALTWVLVAAGLIGNSGQVMRDLRIVKTNQYNTIAVKENNGQRNLLINNNFSSMYTDKGEKHEYIEFIERIAITPIPAEDGPKDVLVLGAGGFTLGADDAKNLYDFVDIDEDLKDIAEQYILKKPVGENKTFHPMPARAFLTQTQKKYDVIVLDIYSGALTLPEHLATKEFFESVKNRLKPDGKMIANTVLAPNFNSAFSRHFDNTIRSVFPHVSRHAIHEQYRLWEDSESLIANVIYIYKNTPDADTKTIYTDIKNQSYRDRPAKNY